MMNDFSIVPPHLAVKAMRDNGYKNMAYALAELIDNSIQADATCVDVMLAEKYELVSQRTMSRIHQIAVLDNGSGMDATVLRMALQFGNGTRLDASKRTGMGRFGMGLPSASISQCRRVEVWSWQGDITQAMYTYLDLDDIERQRTREIPIPQLQPVPKLWLEASEMTDDNKATGTGTLIVWSHIDRSNWITSQSIIKNSEFVVGRMYRHFLYDKKIRITMRSLNVTIDPRTQQMNLYYLKSNCNKENSPCYVEANDPLHLIGYHHLQAPWNREPMFEPFGDRAIQTIDIPDEHGVMHQVVIRTSVARDDARNGDGAGASEHGKHAARNLGISIVRAGRELDMDEGVVIQHDPVERWWGMEIMFSPALDEVFGVTNNKQAAVKLREVLGHITTGERKKSDNQLSEEYEPLRPLADCVRKTLSHVRQHIKAQKVDIRNVSAVITAGVVVPATKAIVAQQQTGYVSQSDQNTTKPPATRVNEIAEVLQVTTKLAPVEVRRHAEEIVASGRRAIISEQALDTSAFFSVRDVAGVLFLYLNVNHPMYDYFFALSEKSPNMSDSERIRRMRTAVEMLLVSWARMEDEAAGQPNRADVLRRVREEWGSMARVFLEHLNEHP